MTTAVATGNIILGLAYLGLGALVLLDLYRQRSERGVWQMGAALAALCFTCGPHHVVHGVHVGFEHHPAGRLDLVTVLVGLPPGVLFLWLRAEALGGGRGDRLIAGTPGWVQALPVATGAYVGALLFVGIGLMARAQTLSVQGLVGLTTFALFSWIGVVLVRTQVRNRPELEGWSLSGLGLSAVFITCATMHAAVAMETAAGVRSLDVHMVVVDLGAIVAAGWFLHVVRSLTRAVRDEWNAVGPATAPAT
jgi:hypothetical protein